MQDLLDGRLPEGLEDDLQGRPSRVRTPSPHQEGGPSGDELQGLDLPYEHLSPRARRDRFGSSQIQTHVQLEITDPTKALDDLELGDPRDMIQKACDLGPTDPKAASVWLAGAMLAHADKEKDGRLRSLLLMLAPMVARSNANLLLGPPGAKLRSEIMPNGWTYTIESWPRMRYAWREGLVELLHTTERDRRVLHTLDDLSKMSTGEADPVTVAIQESWPPKPWATIFALLGIFMTGLGISREISQRRK